MPYYPSQTLILAATRVRRERRLPLNAISEAAVREGQFVEANEVVLSGLASSGFIVLDALRPLGLSKAADITPEMFLVQAGSSVQAGSPIMQIGSGRRARVVTAPTDVVFVRQEGGDLILQTDPQPVEVRALYPGQVTVVKDSGATCVLETVGALLQGAWGNGKEAYSMYRFEPKNGIESLASDALILDYRGMAMVMNRPITSATPFAIVQQQTATALIAPSMHADLIEEAMRQPFPILLTEGFGELKMSEIVYNLLRDNEGKPAAINAIQPARWSAERPEIMISLSVNIDAPQPVTDEPLSTGVQVRIIREPHLGMTGIVQKLAETPKTVENGLRLPVAEVKLSSGQTVNIPFANLEMLGRPSERS